MSKEFWNSLAKTNKTTGFSDYSISFFDQIMRLKVVEQIIEKYVVSDGVGLDFGCGSGDFIPYFAKKFKAIVGYGISEEILKIATDKCKHLSNILLTNSLDEIDIKFDVAISITVLQHILDDRELSTTVFAILSRATLFSRGRAKLIPHPFVNSYKFSSPIF